MSKKKVSFGMMLLCLVFVLGLGLNVNMKTAQAVTKKQVKTKISTLKKDIKSLKKQYNKAVAQEKKQRNGVTSIFGDVISFNPFVVYDTLTKSYYWVTNPNKMSRFLYTASGSLKLTGKYKKYEGHTCAVGRAVSVSRKAPKIKEKIEKKQQALSENQNALKDRVDFEESTFVLTAGTKASLNWSWRYSGKYNNLKWKSSKPNIASVNSSGMVAAKKVGTVTISATSSLSKKVAKCKVKVVKKQDEEQEQSGLKIYKDFGSSDSKTEVKNDDYFTMTKGDSFWLDFVYNGKHVDAHDVDITFVSVEDSDTTVLMGAYDGERARFDAVAVGGYIIEITYEDVEMVFGVIVEPSY